MAQKKLKTKTFQQYTFYSYIGGIFEFNKITLTKIIIKSKIRNWLLILKKAGQDDFGYDAIWVENCDYQPCIS